MDLSEIYDEMRDIIIELDEIRNRLFKIWEGQYEDTYNLGREECGDCEGME